MFSWSKSCWQDSPTLISKLSKHANFLLFFTSSKIKQQVWWAKIFYLPYTNFSIILNIIAIFITYKMNSASSNLYEGKLFPFCSIDNHGKYILEIFLASLNQRLSSLEDMELQGTADHNNYYLYLKGTASCVLKLSIRISKGDACVLPSIVKQNYNW